MDIKKVFDDESEDYEFTSRAVNIYFDEALDELVKSIKVENQGNLNILDVCCGTGILTKRVADRFPDATIFGVDFSEGMLSVARKKMKNHNFKVFVSDISDCNKMKELPMFDIIVSSFGIHNLHGKQNKQIAFKNILEHLKKNGQFIICDIIKGKDGAEQKHFDDFQRQQIRKTYSEKETDDWMNLISEEDDPETLEDNIEFLRNCDCERINVLWKKEFLAILEAFKK